MRSIFWLNSNFLRPIKAYISGNQDNSLALSIDLAWWSQRGRMSCTKNVYITSQISSLLAKNSYQKTMQNVCGSFQQHFRWQKKSCKKNILWGPLKVELYHISPGFSESSAKPKVFTNNYESAFLHSATLFDFISGWFSVVFWAQCDIE